MLQIENLTYRMGDRILFDRTSATISAGERVGFVGRNGTGKTTLLRLITGDLEADQGEVKTAERWRVGVTRQDAPSGPGTLLETVLAADTELGDLQHEVENTADPARLAAVYERLQEKEAQTAPARAARILAGLGFGQDEMQRPLDHFSGGWRMRVMLASLLFTRPDLLLLDEPTNHLDLEASLWLEDYLKNCKAAVLIVSHDRGLLNRVAKKILHLEHRRLTLYQGNFDQFEQTRKLRLEQDEKFRRRQLAERARMQKFIERFRYKATKARQAQSRLKMLERMEPITEYRDEASIAFQFPNPEPLAPPVFSSRKISIGYSGIPVLRDLSLRIDSDDRIALLGANGNGKSTLLRFLANRLKPISGDLTVSPGTRVAYFAQHQAEELDLDATPMIELARNRPGDKPEALRSQLARFGFSGDLAETKVRSLSGGEKTRLLFALMTAKRPHILLLDEPTNHLDMDSRDALIRAINAFAGAVIIVSHESHVIELTADRLWLVAEGTVSAFDGDLADYRNLLLSGREREQHDGGSSARAEKEGKSRRDQRKRKAARRQALAPIKGDLREVEQLMESLAAQKSRLEAVLMTPEHHGEDTEKIIAVQKDLGRVIKSLSKAEERWLDLQAQLEAGEATAA